MNRTRTIATLSVLALLAAAALFARDGGSSHAAPAGRDAIRGSAGSGGKRQGGEKPKGKESAARKSTEQKRRSVRFIWPTKGRKIVERYGERTNPETGTVTINPGINIAASSGSAVVASAAGTVSLVSWLPSYGTIVIVEHDESYRTVYGNLADASVSRGVRVKAGRKIGTLGKSSLHFEVWRGRERLNPLTVLR